MVINQKKVEIAVAVLEKLQKEYKSGFPKEIKGDISSFGASIIQAGLLPSVLFFSEGEYSRQANENAGDEDTKVRRAKLMQVIFEVLNSPDEATHNATDRPLFSYVLAHRGSSETLGHITEAALAVKIALRAFKFSEEKQTTNPSPETPTT